MCFSCFHDRGAYAVMGALMTCIFSVKQDAKLLAESETRGRTVGGLSRNKEV